jgi:TolA-binding protein
MRRLAYIAIALTTTVIASAAHATAVDTSGCAAMTPLDSVDIVALQGAADCYGNAASIDDTQVVGITNVRAQNVAKVADLQKQIAALQVTIQTNDRDISTLTAASKDAREAQTARLARVETLRSGDIPSPSLRGVPQIPSEFDPMSVLLPTWGKGTIPPSMGSDPLGAFRFICGGGDIRADDPIKYPGQPGASHAHQFYGNTDGNAYSDYVSLRTHGDSTCGSDLKGHAVNRSLYWTPAMEDGKGNYVNVDVVGIYYKRIPDSNSKCHPEIDPLAYGICLQLPEGLRFIGGSDMKGGYLQAHTPKQIPYVGAYRYNCVTTQGLGIAGISGQYFDLASMPQCPVGAALMTVVQMPNCWDGKHQDTKDHGSHMDYMYQGKCPATHPYLLPFFLIETSYTIRPGDDTRLWRLASDHMDETKPRGWSLHADWFGAWDPKIIDLWTDKCINGHLSGTGGDLCEGHQFNASGPIHKNPDGTLVRAFTNPVHLVPMSSIKVTPKQGTTR